MGSQSVHIHILRIDGTPQLMLARSARPMNPGAQDVLFYIYAADVAEDRKGLKAKGMAVSETMFPPHFATRRISRRRPGRIRGYRQARGWKG
jgi:hypothetical protein